ncbi:hypothetical protein DRF65_21330 [Chryseobacterium pennae]|uniref:DUF4382 domain-containing protein n=1 Tax=Chryseobacterium pennae TaxID=2258962 RepID=A0A3D9C3Q4_9FLAO|nr:MULTISPECIES: hypothetical protein [Chryseobacterium]MCS4305275.1 hypothetical protein [Chryseobacterium sp. BIGb0232]REC60404.1 hypothetical protein DRF65_21330 [Chryseobacterium pennae]ROS07486.1 hypothetical protein EDF65_4873 [Chryseobacterium nakagawai]
MKKILPIILLAGVGFLAYSCDNSNNDPVVVNPGKDNDTFPIMMDATGSFTAANNFTLISDINIQATDVVLVYKKEGNLWQQIPKTYFLDDVSGLPTNRELDYNFKFNSSVVNVETKANFNQGTQMTSAETAKYLTNQTFRIVLVPADPAKKAAKAANSVDLSDYNAVIKYYNIDESKVKTISAH